MVEGSHPSTRHGGRGGSAPVRQARSPVRDPEIAELRAFCIAADTGSIGRAANVLHVSQPALSKRLRTLEALIGAKLLYRSSRGVRLTPTGSQLYLASRRLLDSAEQVQTLITGMANTAPAVRVAADPNSGEVWLPPALVALQSGGAHRLSVELVTANSAIVRSIVREGRADLGLAALEPEAARSTAVSERAVWQDEIVLAVPLAHPWAKLPEIDPAEFAGTAVIRHDPGSASSRLVERALAAAGLRQVPPLAEIGSTTAALAIARSAQKPALVSGTALSRLADPQLLGRRVRGISFRVSFGILWTGQLGDLSPAAQALAAELMTFQPGRAPAQAATSGAAEDFSDPSAAPWRGGIRREITFEMPSPPIDTP